MARSDSGFACHTHDDLVSYEIHHVWPSGYHGPDTPENRVQVCPNAHSDIHYLLERLLRDRPVDLREYGNNIRRLALRGYNDVLAYAEALSNQQRSAGGATSMTAREHVTTCELLVRNGDCTCPRPSTALQLCAHGGRLHLYCPHPDCAATVHSWAAGATVTVPQVLAAETHHRNAAHPFKPSPDDLHDAVGYDEQEAG